MPTAMQSYQDLHCPLTELLDITECMNGEQRLGWYHAHAQDDLNVCILHMFEDTFSLDMAHIFVYFRDTGQLILFVIVKCYFNLQHSLGKIGTQEMNIFLRK